MLKRMRGVESLYSIAILPLILTGIKVGDNLVFDIQGAGLFRMKQRQKRRVDV